MKGILHKDEADTTDPVAKKFRRGVDWVQEGYDDRWPARGAANVEDGEWSPLDNVNRRGRQTKYLRRPQER